MKHIISQGNGTYLYLKLYSFPQRYWKELIKVHEERYALADQLRRASYSPSIIR